MTKEDVEDVNILASFLTFIGKEAYSLFKTLAFSEKPILLSYATLKELLLDHVKCTDFERCNGAKSPGMIRQDIQNTTTLLRHPNPMGTQGYADTNSLRSRDAGESSLDESHVLITDVNAYLSDNSNNDLVYSNAKSKRNMNLISYASQSHDGTPQIIC
ncbi:unnamed protein product [Schistosoma mattheei]|uniref:Uncharacterized protein n=1 Tax=Schistosoma mattheei TaxID=31246 RepID=A0A183NF66_9TREM|nr:unnamed protein product [Schistosoma mattheei]